MPITLPPDVPYAQEIERESRATRLPSQPQPLSTSNEEAGVEFHFSADFLIYPLATSKSRLISREDVEADITSPLPKATALKEARQRAANLPSNLVDLDLGEDL